MRYRYVPWKRNYRKIPSHIQLQLKGVDGNRVVVRTVLQLTDEQLQNSTYEHLGLKLDGNYLSVAEEQIVPSADQGKYSNQNRNGKVVVRHDLPMVMKTISFEVPNWGDWSRGSHIHDMTREVYQRDFIFPREISLLVKKLRDEKMVDKWLVEVRCDEVLTKDDPQFLDKVLYDINLLQENCGSVGVGAVDESVEEILQHIHVDWQFLPPGERDKNLRILLSGKRQDRRRDAVVENRYNVIEGLGPKKIILGYDQFRRYFGAMFHEELVVLENLDYGNAIYVMGKDWRNLSKLSRTSLLSLREEKQFVRIAHTKGWREQLKYVVTAELRRIEVLARSKQH